MLHDPRPAEDAAPSEATPQLWWIKKMENNNKKPIILPLYYHKFAQPFLSEERLGYLYASDK